MPEETTMTEHEREAYDRGADAARAAASWVADGNSDRETLIRILELMSEGDPEAHDLLPDPPNLSGEWGDDPTPLSLAREITGEGPRFVIAGATDRETEDPAQETIDAIADAFEKGVSDVFEEACETELRRHLGIRDGQAFEDWREEEETVGDFSLEITTGNAAMRTTEDVSNALRNIADRIDDAAEEGIIRDENGNTVGRWLFEE